MRVVTHIGGWAGQVIDVPKPVAENGLASGIYDLPPVEPEIEATVETPEIGLSLADAIRSLDPENDDHWTKTGRPAMAAVEALVGDNKIVRADVEAAVPDFDRVAAKEARGPSE